MMSSSALQRVIEVTLLFLRLGFTAFGGPVAHIALYRDEVVTRRKWLTDQEFLDLLGITNLIPGPNSTEMVIHLGLRRAGWAGFLLGGVSFILPSMAMVTLLAWLYARYNTTPQAGWLMSGIQPVVIAVILQALWGLGRKATKSIITALAGLAALALYLFDFHPLFILLVCGLSVMLVENASRLRAPRMASILLPASTVVLSAVTATPFSLGILFLTFLKIGAVLYGSGYVLLAFLHADFVNRLGWLTEKQLLDAIVIGQITPGPVFTSATFIGYILGGLPGAILGTVGIFLPSFFFVALSSSFIPKLRNSPWIASLLDGIIVASLGMMAGVTWQLAAPLMMDPLSIVFILASGFLLVYFRINSTWLILAGALAGLVFKLG
jgi:chromate transporter